MLPELIKAAEIFKIKGLAVPDDDLFFNIPKKRKVVIPTFISKKNKKIEEIVTGHRDHTIIELQTLSEQSNNHANDKNLNHLSGNLLSVSCINNSIDEDKQLNNQVTSENSLHSEDKILIVEGSQKSILTLKEEQHFEETNNTLELNFDTVYTSNIDPASDHFNNDDKCSNQHLHVGPTINRTALFSPSNLDNFELLPIASTPKDKQKVPTCMATVCSAVARIESNQTQITLSQIKLKTDVTRMLKIINAQSLNMESLSNGKTSITEGLPNLPIQTLEKFQDFEIYLEDSTNFENFVTLVQSFGRGDQDGGKFIVDVLQLTISNEAAQMFNWNGKKTHLSLNEKKPIEPTKFWRAIKEAFLHRGLTNLLEAEKKGREWLRQAAQRKGGRLYKRSKQS